MNTTLAVFIGIVFVLSSILNCIFLYNILKKNKDLNIERSMLLTSKEFELLQKQILFIQTRQDFDCKRIEAIERVLSIVLATGSVGSSGNDGGVLH
tara:strand:+ start:6530 stop:6817 length:288 start_codon:yes stop_codon:yes gene_type:complete